MKKRTTMNWFEAKITYDKEVNQEGMMKKVSETYLVSEESFASAEIKLQKTLESRGSFVLNKIRKIRYAEVFLNEEGDRFYKAKVGIVTLNESKGIEVMKYVQMLVQANDIQDALYEVNRGMHGSLAGYQVCSVSETQIMDVFPETAR